MADWSKWLWGAGRTARVPYFIGAIVTVFAGIPVHKAAMEAMYRYPSFGMYAAIVTVGFNFAMLWLLLCLHARRLHDIGRSGWWQVLPFAVVIAALSLNEPLWMAQWGVSRAGADIALWVGYGTYFGFIALLAIIPPVREPAPAEVF